MPNDFEVDEKLTIAKNKPNKIEITEAQIKGEGQLTITAKTIALGTSHNKITLTHNSSIAWEDLANDRYLSITGILGSANVRRILLKDVVVISGHCYSTNNLYAGKDIWTDHGDISAKNGVVKANDVLINSSRELKQDISTLTKEEAYSLLENLEPVKFAFKDDLSNKQNLGFIAEDVPDIVCDVDHKSVRYMEIISALTKVVKEQQKEIKELNQKVEKLK